MSRIWIGFVIMGALVISVGEFLKIELAMKGPQFRESIIQFWQ